MRPTLISVVLATVAFALPVIAQTTQPTDKDPAMAAPTGNEGKSWWQWDKMTGDWGGARTALAEKGITFDMDVTQIIQDNAHGGASTKNGFRYSGSSDMYLRLDTGKMGLWKGGHITLHAEPKWGNGVNAKAGSLMPVNFDAYLPTADECVMALSEWYYTQVLLEGKLILVAGKLWGAMAFDKNEFANSEQTQFMNLGLRVNPLVGAFLPYTDLGAAAIVNPTDWLSILTAVADSEGKATTTGFNTTFHGPTHTSVIHEWNVKIKPFDKPGTQRVGFVWSSMEYKNLQPVSPFKETGPLMMKLLGPKTFQKVGSMLPFNYAPDNVMIYYNFDQYVITKADDPTQGIGLFGRYGWARSDVNAITNYYSFGVGGKGMVPERPKDQYGVGFYLLDMSNYMPSNYTQETGVEMYYSFEIAPWLHVSPDFQIVCNPGSGGYHDTALVWGIRFQMTL